MRYTVLAFMLASGAAWAQQPPPRDPRLPVILVQPYPFAAARDYPDIAGVCTVPSWEYPAADTDQDGVVEVDELKSYCWKIDLQRWQMRRRL